MLDFAYGWPFLSLRGRLVWSSYWNFLYSHGTVPFYFSYIIPYYAFRKFILNDGSLLEIPLFPLIPIWPGFLLNSLIYLCIIGFADLAILSPAWRHAGRPALGHLRSWRRRRRVVRLADRRGLCPTCTHPLVPATADPASGSTRPRRCTECGWTDGSGESS
ncbi:MAG: hypothetical protein C0513_08150 [Isosphaera sp.]|nr:hypothetical protein [Isosphaera sp.]